MRVWPGLRLSLGATFDGVGTNFAVYSEVAELIDLFVVDSDGNEEKFALPEHSGSVWHGGFPDVEAGAQYGFRVHGLWDPQNGQRRNPNKLLLDP